MLKSVTAVGLAADSLIRAYHSWREGMLLGFTDTANGPRSLLDLRNVQSNARSYARIARDLIADAQFATLDQLVRDDIIAIAEELEAGVAEIDDISHPDNIWPTLDEDKKRDITQRIYADDRAVTSIRERLQGKRRGFITPPKGPRA